MLSLWLALGGIGPDPSWLDVAVDGCGDATVVRERVEAMVRASEPTKLHLRLREDGERWAVSIELRRAGTTSQRELEAESCEAGLDAAVLVAALAIDPAATLPTVAEPTPPETTAPPPTKTIDPAPAAASENDAPAPVPARTTDRERPIAWAVDAGVGVGVGVVPGAAAGAVRVLGEIGFPRAAVGLGATYGWPTRARIEPGVAAVLQTLTIDGRGCFVIRPSRASSLAIPLCGTVRAGAMRGRGEGEAITTRRGSAPWLGVGVVAELRWLSRRHVGAFFAIEGITLVTRPSFVVDTLGSACCSSVVAGLASAGLSFGGVTRRTTRRERNQPRRDTDHGGR